MTYQYPTRRTGVTRTRLGRVVATPSQAEVFTGSVQGMKASDIEERFARSLSKLEIAFMFRYRISSFLTGNQYLTQRRQNEKGEVEIDFLIEGKPPIFIDGQIGHFYTEWQADEDVIKSNITDEFMSTLGFPPSVRIPFWKLATQEMSDQTAREFSGDWVATPISVMTESEKA